MFVIYYVWHHVKLEHKIESISSKTSHRQKPYECKATKRKREQQQRREKKLWLVKTSQQKVQSNQKSYDHVYSRVSIAAGSFINEGWIENAKEITQHFVEIRNNK